MQIAAFYHLYAAGNWGDPVREYLAALEQSGFDGQLTVGFVGSEQQIGEAEAAINRPHRPIYAAEGWEQVTLDGVLAYAQKTDGAVMYAHTKGAYSDSGGFAHPWRRTMTRHVIMRWRENLEALERVQAVGCHWLTPATNPDVITIPYFGGNFWMARCDFLRSLPLCTRESRGWAEAWIGLGSPEILDLLPGWPSTDLDRD